LLTLESTVAVVSAPPLLMSRGKEPMCGLNEIEPVRELRTNQLQAVGGLFDRGSDPTTFRSAHAVGLASLEGQQAC
jgi:hypothetical protein